MSRTIPVIFDGEVFRPVEPVDLPAGREYQVTVDEEVTEADLEAMPQALRRILERARAMDLPSDLAAQHDHYLYGTPKR